MRGYFGPDSTAPPRRPTRRLTTVRGPEKVGFPIKTGIRKSALDAPHSSDLRGRSDSSASSRIATGVAVAIAVAGGCGFVPLAPGTAGSLFAAVAFGIVYWSGWATPYPTAGVTSAVVGLCAVIVVLFGLGVWASGHAEREFGKHDDGRIVIDEVVGQLITLVPVVVLAPGLLLVPGSGVAPAAFTASSGGFITFLFWVVTGFVLFRLFDVWKPGAIRWTERRLTGGLGVMADDVVAGMYGAAVLTLVMLLPAQLGIDLSASLGGGEAVS